jgi:adenylate cyclase
LTDNRVERRLAAVLAADVAGYSRLMGADEVGTLQALKTHRRELIDPSIAAFKGRIVKTTGDGMLVVRWPRRRAASPGAHWPDWPPLCCLR